MPQEHTRELADTPEWAARLVTVLLWGLLVGFLISLNALSGGEFSVIPIPA
jgi:hypothetical protein